MGLIHFYKRSFQKKLELHQDGVRTTVLQGCVHRVQARPEEPARAHRSPPGGWMQQEGRGQVVHWQEVRLRLQGQEQDQCSQQRRQVSDESHLGQGDQNPRQCWVSKSQVCQEPSTSGHGTENQNYDVPKQNLNLKLPFLMLHEVEGS